MIEEKYQRLSLSEQEQFSRVVNRLLSNTFLLVEDYDPAEGISKVNREYLFVERNFDLFQDYLELSGFHLERDSAYGVIYLSGSYDGCRVHFDKVTTVMTYTLRLIYEEEREKLTLAKEVIITTADLVQKMIAVGAVKKKPANIQLLPTILFVVSNEQISNMEKLVEQKGTEIEDDEETEPDEEAEYEEA